MILWMCQYPPSHSPTNLLEGSSRCGMAAYYTEGPWLDAPEGKWAPVTQLATRSRLLKFKDPPFAHWGVHGWGQIFVFWRIFSAFKGNASYDWVRWWVLTIHEVESRNCIAHRKYMKWTSTIININFDIRNLRVYGNDRPIEECTWYIVVECMVDV